MRLVTEATTAAFENDEMNRALIERLKITDSEQSFHPPTQSVANMGGEITHNVPRWRCWSGWGKQ